jgi:hypothetical protein
MKRGVLVLLLVGLIVFGTAFLVLIWMDMRHSAVAPPSVTRSRTTSPSTRREERDRRGREPNRESRGGNEQETCPELGVSCSSQYFAAWKWPTDGSCHATVRNGYPEPDGRCTPGGVVPTVTLQTLEDPAWRTRCIRNCQSTEQQKHAAYEWYGLPRPEENSGPTQVCELDHLVPLELGGADGMGNIWPQCGPDAVSLHQRYFKQKDLVENYLAARVRAGEMPLGEAQRGIAVDWVQYLPEARAFCHGSRC